MSGTAALVSSIAMLLVGLAGCTRSESDAGAGDAGGLDFTQALLSGSFRVSYSASGGWTLLYSVRIVCSPGLGSRVIREELDGRGELSVAGAILPREARGELARSLTEIEAFSLENASVSEIGTDAVTYGCELVTETSRHSFRAGDPYLNEDIRYLQFVWLLDGYAFGYIDLPEYYEGLRSDDIEDRCEAMEELAEVSRRVLREWIDPEAIVRALAHPEATNHRDLLCDATTILSRIGSPAVPHAGKLLHDASAEKREMAAQLLLNIGAEAYPYFFTLQLLSEDVEEFYNVIEIAREAAQCVEDLRDTMRFYHWRDIFVVAFSADSATLATAGADRWVGLWEVCSSRKHRAYTRHAGGANPVVFVAFLSDGERVLSAGRNGTIRSWRRDSGQEIARAGGRQVPLYTTISRKLGFWRRFPGSLCPSSLPISDCAFRISENACRIIRNPASEIRNWLGFLVAASPRWGMALSPDEETVASLEGRRQLSLRLWRLSTGEKLADFAVEGENCLDVKFSPDGELLALGLSDGTIRLLKPPGCKEIQSIKASERAIWSLAFSPKGELLAAIGGYGRAIRLWKLPGGEEIRTLSAKEHGTSCLAFSPCGSWLASGGDDCVIRIWDVSTGEEVLDLHGHTGAIKSLCFSPDGKLLVSGSCDDSAIVWNVDERIRERD